MVPQGVLSSVMAKRSSSSMAVLALLGIDRWTPYELVQHMKRSTIHYIWPRAESKMYEELKRLAASRVRDGNDGSEGPTPDALHASARRAAKC